jgi:hypothetical protein
VALIRWPLAGLVAVAACERLPESLRHGEERWSVELDVEDLARAQNGDLFAVAGGSVARFDPDGGLLWSR